MSSFFLPTPDCEFAYSNVRDNPQHSEIRSYIESLWRIYKPFADTHFLRDAPKHFQERFWEMYLGNTLLANGYRLEPESREGGPDFSIIVNGVRIWIEATAPSSGSGDDAVPPMQFGVATEVPGDAIILRLRNAIFEKMRRWNQYVKKGIVEPRDGYIIAINSKRIRTIVPEGTLPHIVKSVYPFGAYSVAIDPASLDVVGSRYEHRPEIIKRSLQPVSTDIFLHPDHAPISAVIYSAVDCANRPSSFGNDFLTVHNSVANIPLARHTFPFGKEYWLDGDYLHHKAFS